MDKIELKAKVREGKGKNVANRLREKNEIPAVIYGAETKPVALTLNVKDIQKILSTQAGENVLITLKVEGKEDQSTLIKEIQVHPVTGNLLHVDLYSVSLTREIIVNVPVKMLGDSPGVKLGGLLEHHLREIKVKCVPTNIPNEITVDISGLNMGDSVHVKDLKVGKDIKVLDNPGEVVLVVSAPKVEEVKTAEEAAEAPTGPEVIGEKEREERRAEAEKGKEGREKEKTEAKTVKQEETKK